MASSSKTVNKSKRSTKTEILESDDSFGSSSDKEGISGKRMKKDDSGINPIHESDSSDEGFDCAAFSSRANKPCEQNSPDSGNIESCSSTDLEHQCSKLGVATNDNSNEPGASSSNKLNTSGAESSKKSSSSAEDKNFSLKFSALSSDTDSDHSNEKANSKDDSDSARGNAKSNLEDSDSKYDPTPKVPRPKHKWSAPLSISSRQYGTSQNYSPDLFRFNCYGSLHMVERLELMDKMKKHDGCVNALHFNSGGTKLVSGSDDLDIIVWDWTVGEPLLYYNSGHRSNVFQAKFMPLSNDSFIVSCGRDGQVRVGEISSSGECKKTRKLAQHKGAAHKLALQPDSKHTFLSCGEDAVVYQIDLRKEKPEKLVLCKSNEKKVQLYSIFVNPLKPYEYVVGGRNPFAKIYDTRYLSRNDGFLKNLCPEHLVTNDQTNITSVVYNYNGTEILASYNDEDIYAFDNSETDYSKYLHRYKGHRNSQTVKGVNYFGPKSEFVISGSDCGYIFFWEKDSEHIVKYMYGDEGGVVNCLEPNPTMPVLATSGLDDDIKIWVPSCEVPPDLSNLKKHLISNMKEREEERRDCPEAFIDQTIWFLMQHLARSRSSRSSAREELMPEDSSSSESDDHEDGAEVYSGGIQCSQS